VVGDREAPGGLETAALPVAQGRGSVLETGRGWEARGSGQERDPASQCSDRPCPGYARSCAERNDDEHRRVRPQVPARGHAADAESPPPIAVEVGDGLPANPDSEPELSAEGVAEVTRKLRVPGRFGELLGFPSPYPDRKVQLGR